MEAPPDIERRITFAVVTGAVVFPPDLVRDGMTLGVLRLAVADPEQATTEVRDYLRRLADLLERPKIRLV